jgi:hypothetical protein
MLATSCSDRLSRQTPTADHWCVRFSRRSYAIGVASVGLAGVLGYLAAGVPGILAAFAGLAVESGAFASVARALEDARSRATLKPGV